MEVEVVVNQINFCQIIELLKDLFSSFVNFGFVVLHKIGHDRTTKLHGRTSKITKKTKYRNLYNDRSTLKNGNQKHDILNQLCQFFVMLYKFERYCTTKLHQRAHKTTKKTKHGNLYNDLANVQKSCFWLIFFNVDRSLYKFLCFVFLVILE